MSNAIHTKKRLIPTTRISPKHQITIPKQVFQDLHLEVGDFLDVQAKDNQIVITPKVLVDKGSEFTPSGKRKIIEAIKAYEKGEVSKVYDDVDEMINDLDS